MKKIYLLLFALLVNMTSVQAATLTGTCGPNLNWSLDTKAKALTITGYGAMQFETDGEQPWEGYRQYIGSVSLPEGLTTICDYAFENCNELASVNIPNTVTTIGEQAFCYCTALTAIQMGNNVTSIGDYAFNYCENLASVTLNNNLKSIGEDAFESCRKITSVVLPNSVTTIGNDAFGYCSALTSVVLSENISTIPDNLFRYCSNLVTITIPNNVTSIGTYAFHYCENLVHVIIGSGVTTIGNNAFGSCDKLHKLTVLATTPPANAQNSRLHHKTCALFVPSQSISLYDDTYWWEEFASIRSLEEDNGYLSTCDYGAFFIAGGGYNPETQEQFAVPQWCNGQLWQFNSTPLDLIADNTFSKIFDLPAGTYEFKLTTYSNNEDEEWFGYDEYEMGEQTEIRECREHIYFVMEESGSSGSNNNCQFFLREADQVKITYNCAEHTLHVERLHIHDARTYVSKTQEMNVCKGETVMINGKSHIINEDAVLKDTIISGTSLVDTICETNIHVLPTYEKSISVTVSESQTPYIWEGHSITESGDYTSALKTMNDCDSIVTLSVTVVSDGWDPGHPQNPGNYSLSLLVQSEEMGTVQGAGMYAQGEEVEISAVANEGYHFVRWSDNNTSASRTIVLNSDIELTAYFAINYYSITFANYDGTELQQSEEAYGSIPSYKGTEPTRPASNNYTYTFAGWEPEIAAVSADMIYTAQFDSVLLGLDTVIVTGHEDIADLAVGPMTHIVINEGAVLNVSRPTSASSITLMSGESCGQVENLPNLTVDAADMVIHLPSADASSGWYAFAVPFEVSVSQGIRRAGSSTAAVSGVDFVIDEYDGSARASTQEGWKRVESTATLYPGRMYMLATNGNESSWQLKASHVSNDMPGELAVSAYPSAAGDHHAGWNGIANPLWSGAYASLDGVIYATVYNNIYGVYEVVLLSENQFGASFPFFVQTPEDGSVLFNASSPSPSGIAPMRMELSAEREATPTYTLELSDASGSYADKVYLTMSSDKEDRYVIGRDLQKIQSQGAPVPQLWINRYNMRLAAHEVLSDETEARIPIGLSVPETGSYILGIQDVPADTRMYLTHNGQIIWDLKSSDARLELYTGTHEEYGIVLYQDPQIPEGIDENPASSFPTKVLHNGQIFIIRGNKVYTVTGQAVQ